MGKERNDEICKLYTVDGMTTQQCAERFKISRERVRQILRKRGIYKKDRAEQKILGLRNGVVESTARDEFLGVNLSESDKLALRAEAERRGISMSMLTSDLIKEMLAAL